MIVHIWLLLIAVLLLWFPRQWLRTGKKMVSLPTRPPTDKDHREANDVSLKLREEFPKPRNWVDLLRAVAGSIGLCLVCFEVASGAPKGTGNTIFIIQCAVLAVAVFIQTVRVQKRFRLVAPVFFILGLSFGLIGWQAALFACVTIWVLNLLLPSAGIFLMVFAGLELVFGRVLSHETPLRNLILAAVLAAIPVLLSAMTNRRLVQLNKKARSRSKKA